MTIWKRCLMILLAAALLYGPLPGALADGPVIAHTYNLGGELDRVRLRESPSTSAGTLGKYFANVKVEVLEQNGTWWKVRIGDREGYMMSRYLSMEAMPEEKRQGISGMIVPPERDEGVVLYADTNLTSFMVSRMTTGAINILATIGYDWLQLYYIDENGCEIIGYALTRDICMAENMVTVRVVSDTLNNRLNLRVDPDTSSYSWGKYYAGTLAYRLFDNYSNNDGWTHVRIGNMVGYMMDRYLSSYIGPDSDAVPPFSRSRHVSLPLFVFDQNGAERVTDTISQSDIIQVLGEHAEYSFVRVLGNGGTGDRYGHVRTVDIEPVNSAISTKGVLTTQRDVYNLPVNGYWEAAVMTVPAGTQMTIMGSAAAEEGVVTYGYVRKQDDWLYVSIDTQSGAELFGVIVAKSLVSYDAALELDN